MAAVAIHRSRNRPPLHIPDEDEMSSSLLRSLTEVGRPAPLEEPKPKEIRSKRYSSRFFYTLEESPKDQIARNQALTKESRKRAMESIDETINSRLSTYKDELPKDVGSNIDRVREFFLKNIHPLVMASSVGAAQSMDVVQRLLGTNIDNEPYTQFDKLIRKAVRVRLTKFVCSYLKVSVQELNQIRDQSKDVIFMPPNEKSKSSS